VTLEAGPVWSRRGGLRTAATPAWFGNRHYGWIAPVIAEALLSKDSDSGAGCRRPRRFWQRQIA